MSIFKSFSNYFIFRTQKYNTIILIQTTNKIFTLSFKLPFINFFINIPLHN